MVTGAGAALALGAMPKFAAAHDHAKRTKGTDRKLTTFSEAESKELDAICECLIPGDEEGPGAREAGALFAIDYVLTHFEPELQPKFRKALTDLATEAAPQKFSDLPAERQIEILKKYETTEGFNLLRNYTIFGFLGDPSYGGNIDDMGWKYIGFENDGMFFPPFGYYDAELLPAKKDGE